MGISDFNNAGMPRSMKIFIVTVLLIGVVVLVWVYYNFHEQKAEVIFFDVGQGDSALINLPGDNEILIDGGPGREVLYKLGKYLPIYNRDIELMILTHPHADHVTGLVEVMERYRVEAVIYTGIDYESEIYSIFLDRIKGNNSIKSINSNFNRKIELADGVFLEVIYPWDDVEKLNEIDDLNDTSIVLKLDTLDKDFLFTGDISVDIEKNIVETQHAASLRADVLKVAHQGSDTSSLEEFINAVSPSTAVISVGKNNFGHPSLRVVRRLERLGAEVKRTDEDGDIKIELRMQN